MDPVLFLLGASIAALAVFDFLKTTIGMSGLGPLTARLSRRLWQVARRVVPRLERPHGPRLADGVGPVIVSLIALMWISLSCLGYTLMFAATGALVDKSGDPASAIERLAFVGVSLSTLGASIVQPGNGWWNALAMVAAVNGMIVLTLSVSFVMNVLQTTASARGPALRVSALAMRGDEVGDGALRSALASLGAPFAEVVPRLRGAPVVGYFCTRRVTVNFSDAVLTLCDLLEKADRPPGRASDLPGLSELRLALRELADVGDGRTAGQQTAGLDATREWARRRLIPHPA